MRPSGENLAPKIQQNQGQRPTLLPQGAQIRPGSSVSTQTQVGQTNMLASKPQKVRTKQTPVRPAVPNIKVQLGQPNQTMQQVVTPQGKQLVTLINSDFEQIIII